MCPICQLSHHLPLLVRLINLVYWRLRLIFISSISLSPEECPSTCVMWVSISRKRGKLIHRDYRCAADYVNGFGLALYFHFLFTKAILQTIIEMVVCPLLQRFYSHFYAVKFQEIVLVTVINFYWLSAFDNDLSVPL